MHHRSILLFLGMNMALIAPWLAAAEPIGSPDCCRPQGGIEKKWSADPNRRDEVSISTATVVPGSETFHSPKIQDGMAWIPGGEFQMGTDDPESYSPEHPAHPVKVDGFWMDVHEVTNADYRKFVNATGYVTVAERKPDWEEMRKSLPPGTPKPDDALLQPGALVFTAPKDRVPLNDIGNWWTWTLGASWRHPAGPNSNLDGKDNHPVVAIAFEDAKAYAKWCGKRLPTEAEWEFAARGGLSCKRYAWGDEFTPANKRMANTFQGDFPWRDTAEDCHAGVAPVMSFPVNPYGLHDMIGNVWEWCEDWYRADAYTGLLKKGLQVNPQGPQDSHDPENPQQSERVIKGGSFLCSEGYCLNYRPSARRGTAIDTGLSHLGFRCVRNK